MQIEACNTWDCINSFSNWLSAFGTILISGIALWLSVKERRILISSKLSFGLISGDTPNLLDRKVFILEFTNTGYRPATIISHYWHFPFKQEKIFLWPELDSRVANISTKLPIEITDGKSGKIFYPDDFFKLLDNPEKFLFHQSKIVALLRIYLFRVSLSTSVSKNIKVKISRSVRKILWDQYRSKE